MVSKFKLLGPNIRYIHPTVWCSKCKCQAHMTAI